MEEDDIIIIEKPLPLKIHQQTPLRRIIQSDRKQRNYAEPDKDVIRVVNELVDKVGVQFELEEFAKKIKQGFLDFSRKFKILSSNLFFKFLISVLNPNFIEELEEN